MFSQLRLSTTLALATTALASVPYNPPNGQVSPANYWPAHSHQPYPTPTYPSCPTSPSTTCLAPARATQVAHHWLDLLGSYTATLATDTLTENFTDYSDAALSLNAQCPQAPGQAPALLEPVFTTRAQFMAMQGPQKAIQGEVLQIWQGCGEVTMRYSMTNLGTRPVVGVIVIETEKSEAGAKYPFRLDTIYSEFDSAAWVQNLKDAGHC